MDLDPSRPLGETLNSRQKWLLVFSLMLALFMSALDQTVVATAIPSIVADLSGFDLLAWLFTTYMLASTVIVPLVGKLSDIFGRKVFVMTGITVFTLSSAACGAAPTMLVLIVFRGLQGLGGGMVFASVFATIGDIFPPAERVKYMGLFTGTFSVASITGPFAGGFLTDTLSWRWVFYINIPFAMVALPAIWFNLPMRRSTRRPKIDFLGAALLSSASILVLLALEWAGNDYAWGSPQIIGLLAAASLLLAAFIQQERRHPEPMLPLHLFKNRIFTLSNLIVFTFGIAMFGSLQYLPTFVQTGLGVSATGSGAITTPQSFGVLISSVLGGQLISRTGHYKWQTIAGAALVLLSMVLLATRLDVGMPEWQVSVMMLILGLGFGVVLPTMSLVSQNAVAFEYLGVATSTNQFSRQIGGVLGSAVFGAVLASTYSSAFAGQLPQADRTAIVQDISPAFLQKFDDPTLARDKAGFEQVQATIRAQVPDADGVIRRAVAAQKESIATAIRRVFSIAAIVAALCLIFTFLLREMPLRKGFAPAAEAVKPAASPEPLPLGEVVPGGE